MSELRRSLDAKIKTQTGPFTIRDLLPGADTKTLNTGSVYLNELWRKKALTRGGKQGKLRAYTPGTPNGYAKIITSNNKPPAQTQPDTISEHQMGQAIYDLVTHLQNDLAAAKRELSTEKTQARLRSAEYSKQLREKDQELKDLRDEIELLERRTQRVVRVPRTIDRATLFGKPLS